MIKERYPHDHFELEIEQDTTCTLLLITPECKEIDWLYSTSVSSLNVVFKFVREGRLIQTCQLRGGGAIKIWVAFIREKAFIRSSTVCKLAQWLRDTLNQILIKQDEKRYLSQFESEMFDSLQ